jgi:hypothetical protein
MGYEGNADGFPADLAEAAMAHIVKDKTEAAYMRGDLLERRRKMMTAWAVRRAKATNRRQPNASAGTNILHWCATCAGTCRPKD